MTAISEKRKVPITILPSEESFYRVFRKDEYSDANLEKMAFFYYAATDDKPESKAGETYRRMSGIRRTKMLKYWPAFVEEMRGLPNVPPVIRQPCEIELLQKEIEQTTGLLKTVIQEASKRDS